MALPHDFLNRQNFLLAWERILHGGNAQYKRLFSHLFPSYIGTKHERAVPNRRTRSLKGVLASKKGRKMSFHEIRKAAAKAACKRA